MLDLLTWTPAAAFFGIVGILMVPFLGVLVVLTLAFGVLVALLAAIVMGSYELAQRLGRRRRERSEAAQQIPVQVRAQVSQTSRVP